MAGRAVERRAIRAEADRGAMAPRDEQSTETTKIGVGRRFIRSFQDDDIAGLSAELAYRFLFAVFPFGLFVAALGAFVAQLFPFDNPAGQIVAALGDNLPP